MDTARQGSWQMTVKLIPLRQLHASDAPRTTPEWERLTVIAEDFWISAVKAEWRHIWDAPDVTPYLANSMQLDGLAMDLRSWLRDAVEATWNPPTGEPPQLRLIDVLDLDVTLHVSGGRCATLQARPGRVIWDDCRCAA